MFFADLAGVQETGRVGDLQPLPVDRLIQLALPGLPLLQLVTLPPGSSQQIQSTMSNAIPTDIWSKDAHNRLAFSQIPSDQGLIPATSIDDVLMFWILVELAAVDSIGMTVMRSVGFFEINYLLSFDFIVDPHDRIAAGCH